jgi:AraC family transcriptional regulator
MEEKEGKGMDWVGRMNEAVGYVEDHLNDGIDCGEIGRIMACPFETFQRSFVQITGISLSEYVRCRRLSRAANDLQNTDDRIIDIALKYGYESADAFSAAFRRLHGVSPSQARKGGVRLKFCCRLSFALTIKGVFGMDYKIEKRGSFRVLGVRRTTPYGGGTWAVVKSDGSNEALKKLSGHLCDLGLCFGFGPDGSNDYLCGVEWDGEETVPGFDTYTYTPAVWLMFEARGKISDQVLNATWQRINNEFLPQSKYKKSGQPTIEKYVTWDDASDVCNVEIWVPVSPA